MDYNTYNVRLPLASTQTLLSLTPYKKEEVDIVAPPGCRIQLQGTFVHVDITLELRIFPLIVSKHVKSILFNSQFTRQCEFSSKTTKTAI